MSAFPGIYRGVCTQVSGIRIRVRVPQLLGAAELADWAEACVPPGWQKGLVQTHLNEGAHAQFTGTGIHSHTPHVQYQLTPKVGEAVWVMFEGGDVNHPVWLGVLGV